MEQVETFSLRSFFKGIYLMTAFCSHKVSLENVPHQNFLYRRSIYSNHIKNLSDGIERLLKLQHGKIVPSG